MDRNVGDEVYVAKMISEFLFEGIKLIPMEMQVNGVIRDN